MTEIFGPTGTAEPTRRERRGPGRTPQRKRHPVIAFLRDLAIVLVSAIVISFVIKTFLIRSFYIPSASMEDTLLVNDRIIVNQLVPEVVGIERGDVVVFQDPGGWLPTQEAPELGPIDQAWEWMMQLVGLSVSDSNNHLIKRVIGLPGDTVVCCNSEGLIEINGVSIGETYLQLPDGSSPVSAVDFEVTVPEGHLWVMGDNRYSSADSREHIDEPGGGFVPIDDVVGRAILITWPVDRWSWLDNHPEVFNRVPDAE